MNPVTADDLGRVTLLEGLPRDELESLASVSTRRSLADGEVLFEHGQPATDLYVLVKGGLILRTGDGGRSVIVDSLGPGGLVGWSALRESATRLSTARAVGASELIAIPVDEVIDLASGGSRKARQLLQRIVGLAAQHLEASWKQLLQVGSEGVITAG
jgi:CRP/FNR family transcriptional regulator